MYLTFQLGKVKQDKVVDIYRQVSLMFFRQTHGPSVSPANMSLVVQMTTGELNVKYFGN